jgi:hypothetical protein
MNVLAAHSLTHNLDFLSLLSGNTGNYRQVKQTFLWSSAITFFSLHDSSTFCTFLLTFLSKPKAYSKIVKFLIEKEFHTLEISITYPSGMTVMLQIK